MREPGEMPVVLIVHEDLGFVCWLGERLAQTGCQAVPALNSRDAVRVVADLDLPIDLAIFDPSLRGVSDALNTVKDQSPYLRTLAVRTPGREAIGAFDLGDTMAPPSGSAGILRQECLSSVHKILKQARVAA